MDFDRNSDELFTITEWVSSGKGKYLFWASINAEHSILKGHFPDMPIVPGVCTLDLIKECASRVLSKRVRYTAIRDCKFLHTILPRESATVELDMELDDSDVDIVKIVCQVRSSGQVMMKLRGEFADNNGG